MILLSGITDSAIAVLFGLFIALTLLTYFLVYKILMLSDDIKAFSARLKEKNIGLFHLGHFGLYILSCCILFGLLSFKRYIFG